MYTSEMKKSRKQYTLQEFARAQATKEKENNGSENEDQVNQYQGVPNCRHLKKNGSRAIAPTFLKFDLWSPGAGFIPIISTKIR